MKRRERSAPIWLFSFVDLAFLLLIALTQLVPDPSKTGIEVARLELPRVAAVEPERVSADAPPAWQLRIHPLPGSDDPSVERLPFELLEPASESATRLSSDELAARLEQLRARSFGRPILAPHRDARSEDLLVAAALLERVWQGDRGVAVAPLSPAVAAARESR